VGSIIKQTLINMGYVEEPAVKLTEVARIVTEKTDKNLSKQRLKAILEADRVSAETLNWLARGLGISVAELVSGGPQKKSKGEG
jgi:hypothetical protein